MTVTYVPERNVSAGRRSLPPWPRYRVVMAWNPCRVTDVARKWPISGDRSGSHLRLGRAEAQDVLGDHPVSTNYVEERDDTYMVAGTRVSLDSIVQAFLSGDSAETIAQAFPVLNLEQVYGAITFYLSHREEVDQYLAARQRDFDAQRQASREADPMFYQKLAVARRLAG